MKSYLSPKVELKEAKTGKGLFTREIIDKDELVIDFRSGTGSFVDLKTADQLYHRGNDYMLQVDENSFFVADNDSQVEEADFLNHSCHPNCGIKGSLQVVAMRRIDPGEEITIDYAMTESSDYQMRCLCGNQSCRKLITGNDWKIPELQERYRGYFSEYLKERIDPETSSG